MSPAERDARRFVARATDRPGTAVGFVNPIPGGFVAVIVTPGSTIRKYFSNLAVQKRYRK